MHGTTHRALTEDVARVCGLSDEDAKRIASWSDFPDRVDDVRVADAHSLVGRRLCSVTHFQRRKGDGKTFEGFRWRDDASIGSYLDLPNVDVSCDVDGWIPIVGIDRARRHPLAVLLEVLRGKASIAADEITYPTAATMAEWLAGEVGTNWPTACGCACHFAQDAAVWHHTRGWLLKCHSSYEGKIDSIYPKERKGALSAWNDYTARHPVGGGTEYIRRVVERTALDAPWKRPARAIRVAVAATAAVIGWWMKAAGLA